MRKADIVARTSAGTCSTYTPETMISNRYGTVTTEETHRMVLCVEQSPSYTVCFVGDDAAWVAAWSDAKPEPPTITGET